MVFLPAAAFKSTVTVRNQICDNDDLLSPLPVESLAVIQTLSRDEVAPIRALDPLLFQAINPDTNVFLWHSIQGIENDGESLDMLTYISYPVKDASKALPKDASDEEIIKGMPALSDPLPHVLLSPCTDMKAHTTGFAEPFKSLVMNITPEKSEVTRIQLKDWVSQPWEGHGRVTLAGDSAGPMTMYRGEGVNHGILDVACLSDGRSTAAHRVPIAQICAAIDQIVHRDAPAATTLKAYEAEVCARRQTFVPLSRQACLDAHDYIDKKSPLVNYYALPKSADKYTGGADLKGNVDVAPIEVTKAVMAH